MLPQDTTLLGLDAGRPAVQTLARTLLARYLPHSGPKARRCGPLKIGIDRDLQQALDVDPAVLRTVLGGYTRRRAYRAALAAPGAMRVDLAGQPVELVTPAQQQARQGARPDPASARPPGGAIRVSPGCPLGGRARAGACLYPVSAPGGSPMAVTATLKFVLREIPASQVTTAWSIWHCTTCPRASQRACTWTKRPVRRLPQQDVAHGAPAHQRWPRAQAAAVDRGSARGGAGGALLAVVKGIQVVAGKAPAPAQP